MNDSGRLRSHASWHSPSKLQIGAFDEGLASLATWVSEVLLSVIQSLLKVNVVHHAP